MPSRKPEVSPRIVQQALENADGNRAAAARALGITRATLYKYLGSPDQTA